MSWLIRVAFITFYIMSQNKFTSNNTATVMTKDLSLWKNSCLQLKKVHCLSYLFHILTHVSQRLQIQIKENLATVTLNKINTLQ